MPGMENPLFSPETTVLEALGETRQCARVFTAHHTACVGCYLARFCTVADVARTYRLSEHAFLDELQQAALAASQSTIGAPHE